MSPRSLSQYRKIQLEQGHRQSPCHQ
jgi:hypothetical protein